MIPYANTAVPLRPMNHIGSFLGEGAPVFEIRTAAGTDQADEALRLAVKRLDVAASKGVIHPNQAARRKSRLMKQLNAG